MKHLWMAVTADKYELPLIVRDTCDELARDIGIAQSSIFYNMNYGIASMGTFNGYHYKIRKVKR